jgi:hypothetical protein
MTFSKSSSSAQHRYHYTLRPQSLEIGSNTTLRLLTMPPERVEALIASGLGLSYDPGTGKVMKNRVLIPAAKKRSWIKLCEEAAAAAR